MRLASYLLTIVLSFGAGLVAPKPETKPAAPSVDAARTASGPYRDGLYLGRLAARAGAPAHASVARWSASNDRDAFLIGYEQGYLGTK